MKKLLVVLLLAAVLIMAFSVSAFASDTCWAGKYFTPASSGTAALAKHIGPTTVHCPFCHKEINVIFLTKLVADGFWDTECYVGWCPHCNEHVAIWGKGIRD